MPRRVVPIAVPALEDSLSASTFAMQREDQRDVLRRRGDWSGLTATPCAIQFRHLIEERLWIEHHTITDHSQLGGAAATPDGSSASL